MVEWYIVTTDNVYFYIVKEPKPFDVVVSGPHEYSAASKIVREMRKV